MYARIFGATIMDGKFILEPIHEGKLWKDYIDIYTFLKETVKERGLIFDIYLLIMKNKDNEDIVVAITQEAVENFR